MCLKTIRLANTLIFTQDKRTEHRDHRTGG